MDVRDLKYENNFFDLVIDKSTIDALLCGENSFLNVAIMIKEVQRVLKVGGVYMIISYGQPENRIFHLVIILYYKFLNKILLHLKTYNLLLMFLYSTE